MMDEAAQETFYAPTIQPHSQKKNGRYAWKVMVYSNADQYKWEHLQK